MQLSQEDMKEFETEAAELLEAAEQALLCLDRGEPLGDHYNAIFRAFHSIKGAAGMMEMTALQSHMHILESMLTQFKDKPALPKETVDLFLRGCDATRTLLEGKEIKFSYETAAPGPVAETKAPLASVTHLPLKSAPEKPAALHGKAYIIDDEPAITEYLIEILHEVGFEARGHTQPKLALQEIETYQPDIVLTDLSMPEMSGMQVLEAIRQHNPSLPVIFVSGHVSKEVLIRSIGLGLHGVIEKPFKETDIVQTCISASQRHRLAKLVNKSINLLLYQFSDLDRYLEASGKSEIRSILKAEIQTILALRKQLSIVSKKSA